MADIVTSGSSSTPPPPRGGSGGTKLEPNRTKLRDEFAMAALTGIIASESDGCFYKPQQAAARSYEIADAMLAARKGGE